MSRPPCPYSLAFVKSFPKMPNSSPTVTCSPNFYRQNSGELMTPASVSVSSPSN